MYRQAMMAAGGGAVSALLFASAHMGAGGGVVFAYFSPLPLLMVGLRDGVRNIATAALVGLILAVILSNGLQAAIYGGVVVLPCWLTVRYALMSQTAPNGNLIWYPAGSVVSYLAGLGAAFLVLTAFAHFDAQGGFQGAVRGYVDQFLELRFRALASAIDRTPMVDRFTPVFPGYAIASWLFMLTINIVLAQGLLVRIGQNLRPSPAYSRLDATEWLAWALVIAALGSLFGGGNIAYVSRNLLIVLAAPYFFIGLGIVHLMVRRVSLPGMALTVFYLFLLFLGWPAIVVAGLGFFEEWLGLRRKFGTPPHLEEEEED